MKAEINKLNKEKFFAAHWDSKIVFDSILIRDELDYVSDALGYSGEVFSMLQLQLTPLILITDDDIIHVAKLAHERYNGEWKVIKNADSTIIHVESIGRFGETFHISMIYNYATINANLTFPKTDTEPRERFKRNIGQINASSRNPIAYIAIVDYLRSKNYAIPFMGLSVLDMVKAGWIKLVS